MWPLPGDSYVVLFWAILHTPYNKKTGHSQKQLHRSLQVDTNPRYPRSGFVNDHRLLGRTPKVATLRSVHQYNPKIAFCIALCPPKGLSNRSPESLHTQGYNPKATTRNVRTVLPCRGCIEELEEFALL